MFIFHTVFFLYHEIKQYLIQAAFVYQIHMSPSILIFPEPEEAEQTWKLHHL